MTSKKITKPQAIKASKLIRKVGSTLESVSKGLATKYALKLFFTPVRFKRPDREKFMYASAQKDFLDFGEDLRIATYKWGSGPKKVLLVHGWSGRATQLYSLAEYFQKEGMEVWSFDAPAHGDSAGKKTHMLQFVRCIELVNEKAGGFDYAISHSLGGLATFNALRNGLQLDKLCTIGMPNSIRGIIDEFCFRLDLTPQVAQRIAIHLEEKYRLPINHFSAETAAKGLQLPVLLVHDKNDTDVNIQCASEVAHVLPQARVMETHGLGHRRILSDETVMRAIRDFLAD